mmetsp:Transcript_17426/g.34234  ORF Transcript_17426/g.34234 Transcript_17426/m.34234 type:complete len:101 (-) Transcript_17426:78-380(-)
MPRVTQWILQGLRRSRYQTSRGRRERETQRVFVFRPKIVIVSVSFYQKERKEKKRKDKNKDNKMMKAFFPAFFDSSFVVDQLLRSCVSQETIYVSLRKAK